MRLLVVVLAGCSFQHGVIASGDGGDSGGMIDASIDAEVDALDPNCFGKSPFTICLQALPTDPITLPTGVNTSSTGDPSCESIGGAVRTVSGVEACMIAGTTITVGGSLVGVYGTRPLVLVATDTIVVSTTKFDITSRTRAPASDGPNANPPQCSVAATLNGASTNGGGGGGAGGSFGSMGSAGGDGAGGTSAGGVAAPAATSFDVLRGGCPGGSGGGGPAIAMGGSGGGAVYLVARNTINITGTINASGAGGRGGAGSRGGGGGGGSGGMIVLHAQTLDIGAAARIFANGGGGGGGAGNSLTDGSDGADALSPDTPAAGGIPGDIQGTTGGTGAYKSIAAGGVQQAAQGAGGGGGGVGVIRVLSGQSIPAINVSPTPMVD